MPLLKRATESNPHRLAHPELWSRSRPADVLVDINFAGLTGSLGQLAVLCADAAEIFERVQGAVSAEVAANVSARMGRVAREVRAIRVTAPRLTLRRQTQ